MFRLQRLEISGFKSFADYTEIVFTGSGITAVVGPNGCGKSNVSDAISWVLGEQRAKSLRGGEMKDVVFAGTRDRKPGGMAEVVLHLVRDDSVALSDEPELEDIDEALTEIDEAAVDMDAIEGLDAEELAADAVADDVIVDGEAAEAGDVETVKAAQVGSVQVVETRVKTKRHWRPRSFALDFAPGEAVSVTRRLYLSGESEYLLNGKACRLRDISDLFAGTGLSGSHYAIIEQGRIGQILSAKPTDRRNLIEEAAGISKFRTRQRAAETRLDSAKANLSRITDIVSEVDTRVNSLRRQAAKTRRFKILQEEFRVLLRQLYAAEGKHFTELSAQLETNRAQAVAEEDALREQLAKGEEAARGSTLAARHAEESLAELRKIHSDNALARDRAEREHVYKSEQVVGLNDRIAALNAEIESGSTRLESIAADLERLTAEDLEQVAELETAEGELRSAEDAQRSVLAAVTQIEADIESKRAELIQHTSAAERFDEIGRQLEINLEKVRNRLKGLEAEAGRADQNLKEHEAKTAELSGDLEAEKAKLAALTAEKNELLQETGEAREKLRIAEAAHRGLADEFAAKKHRLETLSELEEKRAVYAPQVQKLFAASDEIGVRFKGVLADHLKVAEKAEKAVEALFGSFLESIVVSSLADAKRVSAWLRENNVGRTALLIDSEETRAADERPAAANSIESHLGVTPEFASVLRSAFPNEMSAILVDDLAGAASFPGSMAVSFAGEILIGGRVLIGGGSQEEGTNQSLLAFKRELTILASEVSELSAGIEAAKGTVDEAREHLVGLEGKTVDLQSLLIKVDRGIHGLEIQLHSAKEEIERAARHRKVVGEESEQSNAEIADLEERIADAADNRTSAENARSESAVSLEEIAATLLAERSALEAANLVLNEKRTAAATSNERRRSVKAALGRVEAQRADFEARIASQKAEAMEAEAKLRDLHTSISEITDQIAHAPEAVAAETAELNAAIDALALARADADRSSEGLAEINHRLADAMNTRAEIEVRQAEAATELKNAGENCQQELNIELAELVAATEIAEDFVLETARADADSLRERLDGFGALNMLALEELAEAEERQVFLSTQRDDIVQSIAATEEALKEIKQRSRERFRQAFEAINENFQEFFRELFGGGQGQMTLLEADDILEAGIEVVAQPPGKRLQNILLLSGGEKAMTAIALVMAIFKYRPSPFCLLDEVDAPLDEANVGRFVSKIADMAEKTQFIVITHNKRTMEAARALYGVTMQEPGVSKIVSVKFE
ncbi:MAG: chromosome segregation protein SMC [Acidobacteria bacterium]|nr:chromosome segregation protein SMC [Acidobacteriota bacterium]